MSGGTAPSSNRRSAGGRVLIAVLIALLVAGIGVFIYMNVVRGDEKAPTDQTGLEPTQKVKTVLKGSNPAESRLRDGAHQVHDASEALRMAQDSLARVNKELAAAASEEERARLQEKKKLIEETITRFRGR